jgi:hypothetical protein
MRNNFVLPSSTEGAKRKLKLKINKVDGSNNENLSKKLKMIRQRNKFKKMIMGLEVSIKKEMMHLDAAEDSIVSSITGNKVSSNQPILMFNLLLRPFSTTTKKESPFTRRTAQASSM